MFSIPIAVQLRPTACLQRRRQGHELVELAAALDEEVRARVRQLVELAVGQVGRERVVGLQRGRRLGVVLDDHFRAGSACSCLRRSGAASRRPSGACARRRRESATDGRAVAAPAPRRPRGRSRGPGQSLRAPAARAPAARASRPPPRWRARVSRGGMLAARWTSVRCLRGERRRGVSREHGRACISHAQARGPPSRA